MFQVKNILLSKNRYDEYMRDNHIQFNYTNNFNKPLTCKQLKSGAIISVCDDIGWSCSIKSVQMLLSYYFIKWNKSHDIMDDIYREKGSLSIHKFLKKCKTQNCKETVGDYFGVYTVLQIYKMLLTENNIFQTCDNIPYDFMHITTDNIIDIDEINRNEKTILIFSTRLGMNKLEDYYKEMIIRLFLCPHFDGILGGVGKSCYYFMGRHTYLDHLTYLDPHFITDYDEHKLLDEIRGVNYLSTHIDNLNPSLTFCFSYDNIDEFMVLKKFLELNTVFNILHKKSMKAIEKAVKSISQSTINLNSDWEVC